MSKPKERYITVVRWNLAWVVAEMVGGYIVNQSSVLFREKADAIAEAEAIATLASLPFRT